MSDENDGVDLQVLIDDSQRLMKQLRRSIRSSIALSRRRSEWRRREFFEHAMAFGETLEWRNDDLGYRLGEVRRRASKMLNDQLSTFVEEYQTYFFAYLTVAEHVNAQSSHAWRVSTRSRDKINVICELHSQALVVAEEVTALVAAGLSTGAVARWRTLYEIATIARFIARSPKSVSERYSGSHIVEQWRQIERGDTNYLLRDRRYRDDELRRRHDIESAYEELVAKYGEDYGRPYGWASERLGVRRVTFSEIERRVGDKRGHVAYVEASRHIHGERLSSLKTQRRDLESESLFIAGPISPYMVQIDTIWTLQDLTWLLASLVSRSQDMPEPMYWGYVAHMYALDVDTSAFRGSHETHPGFLRQRIAINDSGARSAGRVPAVMKLEDRSHP